MKQIKPIGQSHKVNVHQIHQPSNLIYQSLDSIKKHYKKPKAITHKKKRIREKKNKQKKLKYENFYPIVALLEITEILIEIKHKNKKPTPQRKRAILKHASDSNTLKYIYKNTPKQERKPKRFLLDEFNNISKR